MLTCNSEIVQWPFRAHLARLELGQHDFQNSSIASARHTAQPAVWPQKLLAAAHRLLLHRRPRKTRARSVAIVAGLYAKPSGVYWRSCAILAYQRASMVQCDLYVPQRTLKYENSGVRPQNKPERWPAGFGCSPHATIFFFAPIFFSSAIAKRKTFLRHSNLQLTPWRTSKLVFAVCIPFLAWLLSARKATKATERAFGQKTLRRFGLSPLPASNPASMA